MYSEPTLANTGLCAVIGLLSHLIL